MISLTLASTDFSAAMSFLRFVIASLAMPRARMRQALIRASENRGFLVASRRFFQLVVQDGALSIE
jgi:hypothetical protein